VCHVLFSVLLYKGVTMSPEVYAGVSRSYWRWSACKARSRAAYT